MKNLIFSLIAFNLFAFSAPEGVPTEGKLKIQNRVLINVLDKPISVLDVVKKMNVVLERNYPEYKNIPEARYQFYKMQWKTFLSQMIDAQLMLKDAEKLDLKITDADIREEIHMRFGPDIMRSFDTIGISYEEAKEMVRSDMTTQRMMWYRVHSKALSQVNPESVRISYADYLKQNPKSQTWTYEVLSVRSKSEATGQVAATKAFDILQAAKMGLKEAANSIQTELAHNNVQINVSEIITAKDSELSESHKNALVNLDVGAYSTPIEQLSKNNQEKVFRVFHLIGKEQKEPEPFAKLAEDLKDKLIDHQISEYNKSYILKLRQRFGFKDLSFLDNIEPFSYTP